MTLKQRTVDATATLPTNKINALGPPRQHPIRGKVLFELVSGRLFLNILENISTADSSIQHSEVPQKLWKHYELLLTDNFQQKLLEALKGQGYDKTWGSFWVRGGFKTAFHSSNDLVFIV